MKMTKTNNRWDLGESPFKIPKPFPWHRVLVHLLLIAGAVIMLYPLIWMLSSSLKPENQIFTELNLIPDPVLWENWTRWLSADAKPQFARMFLNSTIIASTAVIGNIISCSMAAYAFARLDFRFKSFWFAMMLVTIMLPTQVTLVPRYTLFHYIGWVNTFLPLVAPKFLAVDAFFIFLMVQFIRGLPNELDDAAKMDGCNPLQTYFHIILPLMAPAIITTGIFTFIWTWDDFFGQLIYLNAPELFTVPLGLRLLVDISGEGGATIWGPMLAIATVSIIPIFLVFLIFQRYLVEGIATTGSKG